MYGLFTSNENFPSYTEEHASVVSQVLTKELYDSLYLERTKSGFSLDKAIQLSVDIPSTEIGFTIGDEESISKFLPLLMKIIAQCQKYYNCIDLSSHLRFVHKSNFTKEIKYNEPKSVKSFIFDMKFYFKRNLKGYSLPCHCTRAERREINAILVNLLNMLKYDYKTQTYRFEQSKNNQTTNDKSKDNNNGNNNNNNDINSSNVAWTMDESKESENRERGASTSEFLNEKESKTINLSEIDEGTLSELETLCFAPNRQVSLTEEYLVSGLSRDFPDARSIFYNIEGGIGAWTNHENHLECVILDEDCDLNMLYKKFTNLMQALKSAMKLLEIEFIRNKQFGYIVTNPKYLGSAFTIDLNIKCPKLANHNDFGMILDKFNLQLIDNAGPVYHFETINTLGRTENQIVQALADCLPLLLRMEKMLAKNRDIDSMVGLI